MRAYVALVALLCTSAWPSPVLGQPAARQNLRTFSQDPARVASLKRGVAVMKARKPSDPKSWFFQAAIHGVSQEFIDAALARDPDVAKVDQARFWNQCPHNGQPSADFLIWHRAYLFSFEQILREAASDPTLSVPYWAYNDGDRRFPAIFGDPELDLQTNTPTNPLFEFQREAAFVFGLYDLSLPAVSTQAADAEKRFFGPTEWEGFAGAVGDADPDTIGLIEGRPHNLIHFAVGGSIGDVGGNMSSVPTAAFDPIFWVHHANIDRLWSMWDCGVDRSWGAVPTRDWFEEKPWVFHDVNLSLKGLSRLQYIKYSTLSVAYDTDDPNCSRLSETDPLQVVLTKVQTPNQPFRTARRQTLGDSKQALSLSASTPVTREVILPRGPVFGAPDLSAALRTTGMPKRRVLLELRGISYDTPPSVGYEVYVNLPPGAVPESTNPSYVGNLNLFGLKHHDANATNVQSFDVTTPLTQPGADANRVRVTIVPFDLLEPRARGAIKPLGRSGNVSVSSMGIVVAESGGQ